MQWKPGEDKQTEMWRVSTKTQRIGRKNRTEIQRKRWERDRGNTGKPRERDGCVPTTARGTEVDSEASEVGKSGAGGQEGQSPHIRAEVGGQSKDSNRTVSQGQREAVDTAARLPGREVEKRSCWAHGTGCWGWTKPDCSRPLSPQCLGLRPSPGQRRVPAW